MRTIKGLTWASPCGWPTCIPRRSRLRGVRAAGIRYEKAVAAAIPGSVRGQWFEYTDAAGHGYCQPDIIVVGKTSVLVVECKLTDVELARRQLAELYVPVLRHVYGGRPVYGLVVVRHLTPTFRGKPIAMSLIEALQSGDDLVHWLGHTKLAASSRD